jgi:uncharacterized protein YkwD
MFQSETAQPMPWISALARGFGQRPTGRMRVAVTALAVGVLFATAALPAAAAVNCTVSAADLAVDSEEQALLNGINAYRQQNGLTPLQFSNTLRVAAPWLSRDMATKNYFSHTDSLGRSYSTRLTDCGYPAATAATGENIYYGSGTDTGGQGCGLNVDGTFNVLGSGFCGDAAHTLSAWKHSPGHNANLLNSSFRVAGIGRASTSSSASGSWYWTLDLGSYVDSTYAAGDCNSRLWAGC